MSNLNISRAQRLDQKVIELVPTWSRGLAARLIDEGKVMVNGTAVLKAGYKLRDGDVVAIDYEAEELERIPEIDTPILYENDDVLVLNKPAGLLTHSKGAYNSEATVASFVGSHLTDMEGDRAGIAHRLDRATSGVIICARNPKALSWLQKQFSQRKVKKTYIAIIQGNLKEEHAIIDMPIERNPKRPQTFRVGADGKSALTEYKVVQTNGTYTMLQLTPATGRTHQLRVHLHHLGHPMVGDTMYSGAQAERLYLHALRLELTLPSRERMTFEAVLPDAFEELMKTQ